MTSQNRYRIPKHLDDPEKLGFWTIDEAGAFLLPVILGIIGKVFITGFIAGCVTVYLLKKAKGTEQANILLSVAYWYLPYRFFNLSFTPPSYQRRLVG